MMPVNDSTGIDLIAAERRRQMSAEGENFSLDRDKAYANHELLKAAVCYLCWGIPNDDDIAGIVDIDDIQQLWPFEKEWWKPSASSVHRLRDLEKAGALIAAEIDRMTHHANRTDQRPVITINGKEYSEGFRTVLSYEDIAREVDPTTEKGLLTITWQTKDGQSGMLGGPPHSTVRIEDGLIINAIPTESEQGITRATALRSLAAHGCVNGNCSHTNYAGCLAAVAAIIKSLDATLNPDNPPLKTIRINGKEHQVGNAVMTYSMIKSVVDPVDKQGLLSITWRCKKTGTAGTLSPADGPVYIEDGMIFDAVNTGSA